MKPYFYPDLEKQVLFKTGYIASKSSHSRGSAVDFTLLDMRTGKEVDMGKVRKFNGIPYILHDVIENTDGTLSEIEKRLVKEWRTWCQQSPRMNIRTKTAEPPGSGGRKNQ